MTDTIRAAKDSHSIHSYDSYADSYVSKERKSQEGSSQNPQAYNGPPGESAPSSDKAETNINKEEENADTKEKKPSVWQRLKNKDYWVAREKRRGVLPNLSLIPEFKDARDYPPAIKKTIVFIIAFSSMMGPMATNIIYPAIGPIKKDYDTTSIMVNVSIGVYQISLGVFPLWWSSISEMKGRRTVYVISFILLLAFNVGAALAPSIQAFTVLRVCSGAAAASVQSVGAGTVADLYIPEERGRNIGIYYMGPLMSPLISPIVGAALVSGFSWRSTQWFMVILSGVNVVILVLFLPETLRDNGAAAITAILQARRGQNSPEANENQDEGSKRADSVSEDNASVVDEELERVVSRTSNAMSRYNTNHEMDPAAPQLSRIQSYDPRQEQMLKEYEEKRMEDDIQKELSRIETAKSSRSTCGGHSGIKQSKYKKYRHLAYLYLLRPIKSIYFLEYPPVLLTVTFSAISFAILYFVNMTIEYGYSRPPYSFSPMLVGLTYIPNSVTYMLASIFGGMWTDRLLLNYKAKYGKLAPEARISWNLFSAVVTYPISLLIFGWCLDKGEHWETPLVGTALFGYANMMTVGTTLSYLVDSLPGKGATGVALNNLVRQLLAAVAVFVTDPMVTNMSIGWAFTMLAFIIIGSSTTLIILKRYGDHWRETYDLERLYVKIE